MAKDGCKFIKSSAPLPREAGLCHKGHVLSAVCEQKNKKSAIMFDAPTPPTAIVSPNAENGFLFYVRFIALVFVPSVRALALLACFRVRAFASTDLPAFNNQNDFGRNVAGSESSTLAACS